MTWPYRHPPKGTCAPGCPRFGRCHHSEDCDKMPGLASETRKGQLRGMPFTFARGHNPPWSLSSLGNLRLGPLHRTNGWPEADRVLPVVNLLNRRFGTLAEVARQAGIARSTISQWKKPRRRADPEIVKRLEALAVGLGGSTVHEVVVAFRLLDLLARKHGTLSNAAEVYSERYGSNPDAVARSFFRIKQGVTPVTEDFLDRLCTLVGTHLDAELAS